MLVYTASASASASMLLLSLMLWSFPAGARNVKQYGGFQPVAKRASITPLASLHDKRDNVCGTSMKQCPSSLGGECCPDNYACASSSCYETKRSPSTCGSLVGWHACDHLVGAGCCPDGFTCKAGGSCAPPPASSQTYDCPSDQFLCPSSLGYGCCPNGMGCGALQCYSTQPTTITSTMIITTMTASRGTMETVATTVTTVKSPTAPTATSTVLAQESDNGDQITYKYYPTPVPQSLPLSNQTGDNTSNNETRSGLTTAQLGGIIGGVIAFLLLVIAASCIFIRRLNKLAERVEAAKKSSSLSPESKKKTVVVTESEIREPSPFKATPLSSSTPTSPPRQVSVHDIEPTHHRQESDGSATVSSLSTGQTMTQPDQSQRISSDGPAGVSNSGHGTSRSSHQRQQSAQSALRVSCSSWQSMSIMSDVSGQNETTAELEAGLHFSELPGSPPPLFRPHGDHEIPTSDKPREVKRPSLSHQWMKSVGLLRRAGSVTPGRLDVVDEEWHGFYGPKDRMAGSTTAAAVAEQRSEMEQHQDNHFVERG